MRVAVTGAGGFIGRHVVGDLARLGHEVVVVTRRETKISAAAGHVVGDVARADTWSFASEVDAIVHLAGISDASLSVDQPVAYNLTNAVGTLQGLEASRRSGTRFVLASSQRVYRSSPMPVGEDGPCEPNEPYGFSKLVAEHWLAMYRQLYHLPAVTARFFSVYGPGQVAGRGASGVASIFVHRARAGSDLFAQRGAFRDFTFVDDVVGGIRRLVESANHRHGVYNIATGAATSMLELANAVIELANSRSRIIETAGDRPPESYVADISRAREELGYLPMIGLREGLRRYVASIQS